MVTKPRIFVVQAIPQEGLDVLRDAGEVEVFGADRMISRDELKAAVARSDYLYTLGDTPIDEEILQAGKSLRGIAAMTMVPNVIDIPAATKHRIPVTNIDHVIGKTTADLTLALILGLAWRLIEADRFTRCGKFRQEQSMSLLCNALPDKILGLIGLGRIGREVAKRAQAFDMKVIYTKPRRLATEEETSLGVEWIGSMDDLLQQSDFVSLMASYNESTHLLMGEREFTLMKPSAFFVNTARGRMVDEPALIRALKTGAIAGAALDVYWCEPPVGEPAPSTELFKLDNVILTPHIGSATWDSRRKMAVMAAENLLAMSQGHRPPNVLNPEVYDTDPSLD